MAKRMVLVRLSDDGKQSLGRLFVFDDLALVFSGVCLEPAWKDNQRHVSAIPWGRYTVRARTSPGMGKHYHIIDVINRSFVLIHAGNYRRNTEGCLLPGLTFADLDRDGTMDVASSRAALNTILSLMPEEFALDVVHTGPV